MPTQPTLATIAEYFRLGIQLRILTSEQAVAWADAEMATPDTSTAELIDVSLSMSSAPMLDALLAIPGERNKPQAGRWLLGYLRQSLQTRNHRLAWTVKQAMNIVQLTDLGEEAYASFDLVDDALALAHSHTYGTEAQCEQQLLDALAEYPEIPILGAYQL